MPERRAIEVVAILVLFDPRSDARAALAKLSACVRTVVVVDNNLHGHPLSDTMPALSDARILRNANAGGLAGAYNVALRHLEHSDSSWTHVVFVDEDTDTSVLADFLGDLNVQRLLREDTTATVAPTYRDRASGILAPRLQLGRFWLRHLPRNQRGLFPVANVINSMSVWRRDAIRQIGPFNELLAVDHVDTEYCMRARRRGLLVFISGDYEFAHSIGARRTYQLFGRACQSSGHSPARRVMFGRSMAWLFCRYALKEPAFAALCLLRLFYEAAGIAIAEGDRWNKYRALFAGTMEGLIARQSESPGWPTT